MTDNFNLQIGSFLNDDIYKVKKFTVLQNYKNVDSHYEKNVFRIF